MDPRAWEWAQLSLILHFLPPSVSSLHPLVHLSDILEALHITRDSCEQVAPASWGLTLLIWGLK